MQLGQSTTNNGTYFKGQVPNFQLHPGHHHIVATQKSPAGATTDLTLDDTVQYLPLAAESLAYDDDGNLLSDKRWAYTWDSADRLVKMVSLPFYQPATTLPATPPTTPPLADITLPETKVAGQTVEFTYDAFSRRISKKVTTQAAVAPGAPIPAPELATWEAYVYDGWNMVATYSLQRTTSTPGKVEARVASHVWGPDIGSKLEARSGWQAAGGVGGLLMTLYPSSASGVPSLPNFVVQGPIMDHMGNVTSVLRMDSSAGLAQLRPEFLYDYDAFGKEIRSTALIAGSNPDSYPFHFSTKYTDGETGLVYYGYRFYDPVNGRWINRDPIAEMGGLNLYGMVGNDAVNLFDYLGYSNRPPWPKDCAGFLKDGKDGFVAAMNRVYTDAANARKKEALSRKDDASFNKKRGDQNEFTPQQWRDKAKKDAEPYWKNAADGCKAAEKALQKLADCLKACPGEDLEKMKVMEALLKALLEACKNMKGGPHASAPGTQQNPGLAPDEPANTKPGEWKPEYSPDGSDYTPDAVRPGNGQVRPAPLPVRPAPRPAPARPLMPAR